MKCFMLKVLGMDYGRMDKRITCGRSDGIKSRMKVVELVVKASCRIEVPAGDESTETPLETP